ncbi:MAG: DMT family transporter [Frisingicoccus sp.]|uniref:DMT family transporter n=1 Tax=Frisingicoccus sp. TaxID=1918627 RepID=UPI00260F39A4|nr:DMT family transporter [Frisingicoccus sp.]MDD6233486.1 DMT family transporter [Frisingicoccus sp.]
MRPKNAGMLMLAAFIWGTAFVAQSLGMDYLGPFTFNGVRNFIGALALLPCIWFLNRLNEKERKRNGQISETSKTENGSKKDLILGGITCGVVLFTASSLQQVGIQYTSVGKAGFITACYIVIVPVCGVFLHKKIGWKVWLAVCLSLMGLYFLCITEKLTIGKGDILMFLCALVFSLHIIVIDYFSPKVDGVKMSCIQFFVCGVLSIVPMFALEKPEASAILKSMGPILYAGVLSSGVAYTLQIVGQKNVNPAIASLILSLESCFSVLAGWVILKQQLSSREALGCVLMFAAIILAQLPERVKSDMKMVKER